MEARAVVMFPSPKSGLIACVTIPAKNEEALLSACLKALALQKDASGKPLSHDVYEVLVLVNNSEDGTLTVAEQFQRQHPRLNLHISATTFPPNEAHIGHVRRVLLDEACRRLQQAGNGRSLILTTDADTEVACDWIAQNLCEIQRGADAVGGRILIRKKELSTLSESTRKIHHYDDRYRQLVAALEDLCDPLEYDPMPRHHQHFCGSLAVTPRAYSAVGGIPPTRELEDVAFYQQLVRNDMRFRHSFAVKAFTSARLEGRAPVGLASQLSQWFACKEDPLQIPVASAAYLEFWFSLRSRFRELWNMRCPCQSLSEASSYSGIPVPAIKEALHQAETFGEMIEGLDLPRHASKQWSPRPKDEPLRAAIQKLSQRLTR